MKSSLLKKQIKTTDKQINSKEKEITGNQKGYKKYINKADSVGLSEAWQKKVQKGEYSINELNDEDLIKKIQAYEDWYGKAKNCKQAIVDLRGEVINLQNSQLELFEQWANIPIERAEKKIEKLKSSYKGLDALNAQSSAASQGGSTQAALLKIQNKAVTDSKKEYNKTQKSTSKADNKVDKTAKTLKKSNLTKKEKKKVNAGKKISTKKLSGTKKKRAVAYNKSLENQKIAEKQEKTAKTVYNTAKDNYSMIRDNYVPGEEWIYQNVLADEELKNQEKQDKATQNSYKKTIKNTQKSKVKEKSTENAAKKAEKKNKDNSKKLSNTKSITKNLNKSQQNALKAGKTVSTKGITDKKTLAAIKKHNAEVKKATQAKKAATKASKEYEIAQNAEATAASNAAQSQAELAQATIEAEKAKFDNIKASYETELALKSAESALIASQNKLKQATGKTYADSDLSKADWEKEINGKKAELATKEAESTALKKQLEESVKSGKIKTGTAEWKEMQTAILEADTAVNELAVDIQEANDNMRVDLLYRDLERAIEAAENLQKAIGTLKGLINDDMMFNDDGKLTDFGLTKLSLEMDDYKSNVNELESALEALDRAKERYTTDDSYSESEYLADIKEYQDKAQSALSTLESSRSSIMSILKNQAKAELDALNKVIDKRKEALKRKKEYYDYDKKLKEQSKDIQALQAQALALEGSARDDDIAELARIKAQLAKAQEELDGTIKDHVYELQIQGLDDLSEQLTEDYEKYIKALSQNLDDMSKAFQSVETTVTYAANTIGSTIQSILASYGVTGLTANSVGYDKPYASGTKSVPYDMTGLTQEDGPELIFTKDGVLTPLLKEDVVFTSAMTKTLWEMAQNNDAINPGAKIIEATSFDFSKIPTGTQGQSPSINLHYDALLNVQGDVTKDTLPDLKTILKESSKYTIQAIYKDLRKGGYK